MRLRLRGILRTANLRHMIQPDSVIVPASLRTAPVFAKENPLILWSPDDFGPTGS